MRFSALRRRAAHAVTKYFGRPLDADALINTENVAPFIRRHLSQFYFTLLCASASSAVGSYLYSTGIIGSSFSALGVFICIVWFYLLAPWKENKRVCVLTLGAFFGGGSFAPWFTWFLQVDPGFVVTSSVTTCVGFCSFWAASILAVQFEAVYFKALLYCSPLVLISLLITASAFGGDSATWKFELYPLFLWSMAYVAVYSQEVVLRARRGDEDYVMHAVCLFTDFPAVVLNVVKLLKVLWRRNRP